MRITGMIIPLFCLMASLLNGCATMTAAEHYQQYQDGSSLRAVLRHEIKSGDTKEMVITLLGKKKYTSTMHRKGIFGTFQLRPDDFPDGLKKTDEIIFYPYDERGLVHLIFRNDKLINYNPEQ